VIVSNGQALDFAPQALGETTPTLSNGYFYAAQGLGLLNQFAAYSAIYRKQPSVATLVDKIANSAARLSVKVWDITSENGKVEDTSSAYAKLMANPSSELSPMSFWRWTFSTYEIYGEAFWYKQRARKDSFGRPTGPVVNLLPMHPSRVAVHRLETGEVEYIFTLGVASAGILKAPASDVVAFLRYNPDNLMRGLSRLEPLNSTLLNEDAARRANSSFWTRGARPSFVLTHPGELSQPAQDRIKASVDARHAGADNMGGTMILEEGMTPQIIQLNAEEMQYIESRKMNLQEACMVFDVPPPVVHILDHATFSNITEQMRSMYRDTMSPRLEDVESVIDFSLLPEFFNTGVRETEFDMTEVLRGDFETRADKAVTLRQSGIFTGNESRDLVGLSKSSDAEMDKLYANAALVPLGAPKETVAVTAPVTPTPAQAGEADAAAGESAAVADSSKSLMRKVLAATGRVKSSKKDIRSTLVTEHEKALSSFFDKQRAAVKAKASSKAAGVFDPSAWDGDLASILHTLSKATAQAIGTKVAADLGGQYSGDGIASYLESNSADTAKKINQTTADEIAKAFENASDTEDPADTVDGVFDGEVAARGGQISSSRVAVVGGLAALVAARLSSAKTKTWVVTSGKPRASHSAMDGETVGLNELFSNGMNGPGDYSGGADEVAGCTCDLQFSTEG
jgi:HK97 family phage portal protein